MSTLSVLEMLQEFCGLRGLPVPSALVGASDKSSVQFRAIVTTVARKLSSYSWQEQKIRVTWASVATADQGAVATLFGADFNFLEQGSLWNTSRKIPVVGPISDQEWAVQNALSLAGPPFKCWIGQDHLFLSPVPAAGETFSGVYRSKYPFSTNGTPQATFANDAYTVLFPEEVFLKGVEFLWKKQKGEAYVDDENDFMGLIAKYQTRMGAPAFTLATPGIQGGPRIYVPIGDWPL